MTKSAARVRHERDRAVMLSILAEPGVGRQMEFGELLEHMAARNRPMIAKTLDFHVRYCADKGWLGFRSGRTPDNVDAILVVWISAQGVDVRDEAHAESGV